MVLPGATRATGQKPFTYWQSVARIGVQVADALEYAHRQGVLHRDIKPSNLLLDMGGTVWVTDFGLAKADDQPNLTQTGDILGTLRYMPPEAFDGKTDARSDVYALGLTLYELLALRPAFDEADRNRLIKQVTTAEPPRLDRLNPAVPRDLVTIVHKAIDRDPAHRYPTAGELAADLKRFLADEPIQARRQTQLERYVRWARRNPGIAVLGGVLTAVLVLATVASLLAAGYFNRAAQSERDARHEAERPATRPAGAATPNAGSATGRTSPRPPGPCSFRTAAPPAAPSKLRRRNTATGNGSTSTASSTAPPSCCPCRAGSISTHVLSPSGRQIAVCCLDHNEVYLYDVATGKARRRPPRALGSGDVRGVPSGRQAGCHRQQRPDHPPLGSGDGPTNGPSQGRSRPAQPGS